MIFDHLDNASLYANLGSRFAEAFTYLRNFTGDLAPGKHPLDGDNLFAMVQSYQTAPAAERKWESHRRYVDIQYVLSGEEVMYHRDISTLAPETEYDAAGDYLLYRDRDDQSLFLSAGNFAVFWPHDGHKPGCMAGEAPSLVHKVVMKVLVA